MTNVNSVTQGNSVNAGTAAEVAIGTSPPLSVGVQSPIGVLIRGWILFTPGTACTLVNVRCRQGSIAGSVFSPFSMLSIACVAGQNIVIPFSFLDTTTVPEQAGGTVYVLTTTPNGTGASSAEFQMTVEV